jgi:hypothetical protein
LFSTISLGAEPPDNLQIRLRQLEPNRPLLTDQINGDEVFVRRIDTNGFQCGVLVVGAAEPMSQAATAAQ